MKNIFKRMSSSAILYIWFPSWAPLAKELSVGLRIGKEKEKSILRQTLQSATSFSKEAKIIAAVSRVGYGDF